MGRLKTLSLNCYVSYISYVFAILHFKFLSIIILHISAIEGQTYAKSFCGARRGPRHPFFLPRHSAPLSTHPVVACDMVLSNRPFQVKVSCSQGSSHFKNKFVQAEPHSSALQLKHSILQLSQDILCHVYQLTNVHPEVIS